MHSKIIFSTNMSEHNIQTEIDGVVIDLMPAFEKNSGGVFHMLPGGTANADWFGGDIRDVYGFYSNEQNKLRGGHYHPTLNEMFFTVAGTALWVLSDFRPESPTYKKTIGVVLGKAQFDRPDSVQSFTVEEIGRHARIKVPAGVYHAIAPLGDIGFTVIALGTTAFDADDYRYPAINEVPDMTSILDGFEITPE